MNAEAFLAYLKNDPEICKVIVNDKKMIDDIAEHCMQGCPDCADSTPEDRLYSGMASAPDMNYQGALMVRFYEDPDSFGINPDDREDIFLKMTRIGVSKEMESMPPELAALVMLLARGR